MAMKQATAPANKARTVFRTWMLTVEPVHLLVNVDGMELDLVVDELGGGGARLVAGKHLDRFYEGQVLGPAVLVLNDVGRPLIHAVVKWKNSSVVGLEFLAIPEKQKELIFRFLFRVERKSVRAATAR
jgi:c-di-GMP-binding flagellar brake protein YcgR